MISIQDRPLISVLIPTHNRMDSLPGVLAALSKQTLDWQNFEVIVVVDGINPEIAQFLTGDEIQNSLRLRYFLQKHTGAAAARNLAMAKARAEIIVFFDDDLIPESGCLNAHLRFHQSNPGLTLCLMGAVKMMPFLQVAGQARQNETEMAGSDAGADQLNWLKFRTGNSSLKRQFVLQSHGFDEQLQAAEDTELAARLHKNGMRLFYDAGVIVYHCHPMNIMGFLEKGRRYGDALAVWYQKSPDLRPALCQRYGIFASELPVRKKIKYLVRALLISRWNIKWLVLIAREIRRFSQDLSDFLLDHANRYYLRIAFRERYAKLLSARSVDEKSIFV